MLDTALVRMEAKEEEVALIGKLLFPSLLMATLRVGISKTVLVPGSKDRELVVREASLVLS